MEVVDFLKHPAGTTVAGASAKGVLMVGPPGTGKTLLARLSPVRPACRSLLSGSSFVEMFVGRRLEGQGPVRRCPKRSPSIIFIDEDRRHRRPARSWRFRLE